MYLNTGSVSFQVHVLCFLKCPSKDILKTLLTVTKESPKPPTTIPGCLTAALLILDGSERELVVGVLGCLAEVVGGRHLGF